MVMSEKIRERIINDFTYRVPKNGQAKKCIELGDLGLSIAVEICTKCPESRERYLALTKLDEVIMYAQVAIIRNEG